MYIRKMVTNEGIDNPWKSTNAYEDVYHLLIEMEGINKVALVVFKTKDIRNLFMNPSIHRIDCPGEI